MKANKSTATPSPSEKSNKRYASSVSLPRLNPIAKGLVMVGVKAAYLVPYIRQVLEQAILEDSDDLNPGLAGGSLRSVHSGAGRQLDQARALHAASGLTEQERDLNFEVVGMRSEYDWLSAAGLFTMQTILDGSDEEWITVAHEVDEPINPARAQVLAHVREEAKQANAGIIVFLTLKEDYETTELHQFCDEYIEVAPCEHDLGDSIAFSIDFVSLRHLNALGVGKQMCSISVSAGGFRCRYAQFVAPDRETRVMWALRAQGKKLAEIGSLLGVNKSTVMRRLERLPDPCPGLGDQSGEDWLNRYLELLPNRSAEALDDDTDSATDADEDADFEDLGESGFED